MRLIDETLNLKIPLTQNMGNTDLSLFSLMIYESKQNQLRTFGIINL